MRELEGVRAAINDKLATYEREQSDWDKAYAEAEIKMQEILRPFHARHEEIRRLKAALAALGKLNQ